MGRLEEVISEATRAGGGDVAALSEDLDRYLATLDALVPLLNHEYDGDTDEALSDLLEQTKEDLLEAYVAFACGRRKVAFMALRGVMEGLFSALLYRYQALSRRLWAQDASFHMVHALFARSNSNEFYLFFKGMFDDPELKKEFPGCSAKSVFEAAEDIYARLSRFIHKKHGPTEADFAASTADVFRIFLTFLERTDDDLSEVKHPTPLTWVQAKYGSTS